MTDCLPRSKLRQHPLVSSFCSRVDPNATHCSCTHELCDDLRRVIQITPPSLDPPLCCLMINCTGGLLSCADTHTHTHTDDVTLLVFGSFYSRYSGMKLEVHRRRLWLDVQRQIGMFLDEVNLSALTLPQYLQLLSHVKRILAIGEDFSGQTGDILEGSIRKNSLTYVHNFHRNMMMDFKVRLRMHSLLFYHDPMLHPIQAIPFCTCTRESVHTHTHTHTHTRAFDPFDD